MFLFQPRVKRRVFVPASEYVRWRVHVEDHCGSFAPSLYHLVVKDPYIYVGIVKWRFLARGRMRPYDTYCFHLWSLSGGDFSPPCESLDGAAGRKGKHYNAVLRGRSGAGEFGTDVLFGDAAVPLEQSRPTGS
jgi:hypothetical protein